MLFTIIANLIGLGVVAALVSAVIKRDRADRGDVEPDARGSENQGTTVGRSA